MLKIHICGRMKGPHSRTNKKHEHSLGYKSFSWAEAVSYWWSNTNLLGVSIRKKNNLPYYYNLFFSFLECRGFWLGYVTKQSLYMANLLRLNLSLPYFTHKSIKWPPTKEVKWLHPKMKSREIKVLYLNVCFPHRSLHWPVAEHIFFCQAVQSIWIKIACD